MRGSLEVPTTLPHGIPAVAAPPASQDRIALVVEDDDRAADLVRLLLEAEGFTVLRAANAEIALVVAPQQALSLITLDIQLPGIDGWEFLARIRESSLLAQVPVVIISGIAHTNLTLTRGAAAVLQKPISRAQLKASLAKVGLQPARECTHVVLVVDDDPKAADVISKFLPAPHYAVLHAADGNEAIAMALRLRPALIVLDLMMPNMSGFEVVKRLQSHAETAAIPLLVVTGKQITAQERAALNGEAGGTVRVVEMSDFDNELFVAEVRRTFQAH